MGFLDSKDNSAPRDSAYLDIPGDGNKRLVRPAAKAPTTVWVHKIHKVAETLPSGEEVVLRRYSTVACTSTGRSGAGCAFCTTPDPLWSKLTKDNQYNRKEARVDFPKTAQHVMAVFDHEAQSVKIMKGGNQLYEPMDQWYDLQKGEGQDLRRCDWSVWKSGKGVKTQYAASRMDPSPFTFTPEIEEAVKTAMAKAHQDMRIPADKVRETMYGEQQDDSLAPTTTVINRVSEPAPFEDAPPFEPTTAPVQVSAPAPKVAAAPAPNKSEQQETLKHFIEWIGKQAEFSGAGMVSTLIPLVRKHLNGDINYHKLGAAELVALQQRLTEELSTIRAGK